MPTFRPYTVQEVRQAAQGYNLDPDFVEAVYAVESSRGTNPQAMTARSVKRKRDSTIVRGPFQLEDDTTFDLLKKHKLGSPNIDDPDVHLDLALRLMSDLKDKYDGDYSKVARAYLGGPGGVTNPNAKDELGTSAAAYENKIVAEMTRLKGAKGESSVASTSPLRTVPPVDALSPTPSFAPLPPSAAAPSADEMDMLLASGGGDDLFGMPTEQPARRGGLDWAGLVAENRGPSNEFALTPSMGGNLSSGLERADDTDLTMWLQQLTNEELRGKDFANA